jgi:hypothetical protein
VGGPFVQGRQLVGAAEGAAARLGQIDQGWLACDLDFADVVNAQVEDDPF